MRGGRGSGAWQQHESPVTEHRTMERLRRERQRPEPDSEGDVDARFVAIANRVLRTRTESSQKNQMGRRKVRQQRRAAKDEG